jgi:hypothetical protein
MCMRCENARRGSFLGDAATEGAGRSSADALAAAEFPASRCRMKHWIFNEAISMKLVAIDFETADWSADSACAIGIVSIEKNKITKKGYRLIRPPRRHFVFSYIRGISWADVEAQPTFNEVWGLGSFCAFLERCGLFFGAQCSIRQKCPGGLLCGCRSKTTEGAVHMHRPSRSFTLEFPTGKSASRMYSVGNIP